MIADVAVARLL